MELFTKDKDGNLEKVNGIHDDVATEVAQYWTPKKSGKHPDLGKKHEAILAKDLKVSGKDFFEQVNQNHFIFQNFGPISLKDFLRKARLDKYVKDEYLDDCLHVTSPQPAIGRGEFLLVANFGNINFADGSGDLVDNDGNRIEVKGKHANLGGKNEWFKQMNRSVLFSLFNLFETGTQEKDLNLEVIADLEKKVLANKSRMPELMLLLQNLKKPSHSLARQMCVLFNSSRNLKHVIAAAHFLAYMKSQKANYLFALNDNVFSGFEAPKNLQQAYEIMLRFNVNAWLTGNRGISISMKNGK